MKIKQIKLVKEANDLIDGLENDETNNIDLGVKAITVSILQSLVKYLEGNEHAKKGPSDGS